MNGRDMSTVRVDRQAIEELVAGCDSPNVLRDIFAMAGRVALGHVSLAEYDFFCRQQGCILWTPSDANQRHIDVRVTRELDRKMVHIHRMVFHITHVKEAPLGKDDEVLHRCGNNGTQSTAFGCCLNPACLVRGNDKNRLALKMARHYARKSGLDKETA